MIYTILISLHVIISILLVVVILMQSAKGGGLAGSAFGGGPSMSFLGARGTATFLSRATTVLAVVFMLNSLGLSLLLRGVGKPVSVTQQVMQTEAQNLPRVPAESELNTEELPLGTLPPAQDQGSQSTVTPPADQDQSKGEKQSQ